MISNRPKKTYPDWNMTPLQYAKKMMGPTRYKDPTCVAAVHEFIDLHESLVIGAMEREEPTLRKIVLTKHGDRLPKYYRGPIDTRMLCRETDQFDKNDRYMWRELERILFDYPNGIKLSVLFRFLRPHVRLYLPTTTLNDLMNVLYRHRCTLEGVKTFATHVPTGDEIVRLKEKGGE